MRAASTTLAQVTNLLAIVSAPALDTRDDPSRRGPAAAAAGRDGRRDHVDRRRVEADPDLRRARSTPGSSAGPASTSTSAWPASGWARARSARACSTPRSAPASSGSSRRSRRPSPSCRRWRRRCSTSTAPRGCSGTDRLQDLAQINELLTALERRVTLLGVLRMALGERDVLVRIGSENELPGAALARRRRGRLRPAGAQARDRVGDRAGADGLRRDDRDGARGRRAALDVRRGRLRA